MTRPSRTIFPNTRRRADALGQRLRAARERRRITQAELAARVGVSRATIARLEAGDLVVSLAILVRVLEVLALDADIDRLAADDELGHRLADARLPRPRPSPSRGLADEL